MDIKYVYCGLPEHLVNSVQWIARGFRTNPLSHLPGGSDVVVEYHDGRVRGYDWVKEPSSYIRSIFAELINYEGEDFERLNEAVQLELAKSKVSSLYARKYERSEKYSSERFEEIWNAATSNEMPWRRLKDFDLKFDLLHELEKDLLTKRCDLCGCPCLGESYHYEGLTICDSCDESQFC